MNENMKIGIVSFCSIIALFVLSLLISNTPSGVDNSIRFGILTILPPLLQ